jgi:glycosyltransferase involved in cell wall biosynthesis
VAKIIFNKPYIFEVRDLWPDVPIQMGAIKNKLIISALKKLEKIIYNYAESIIALSPGMRDGVLSSGIKPEKVRMIPNMTKPNEFYPGVKNKSLIDEFDIKREQINIIYFGAIGKSNGLMEFLEKFGNLNDNKFRLIIAGEGSEKLTIKKYVIDENLNNVDVVGNYPMKKMSELVNCCDISLVSFADIPILYTNSPNKLFDSLSAGKPIIVNSSGWTKKLVEKNNCGFYYNPKSEKSFNSMIKRIKNNPDLLEEMAQNSRKLSKSSSYSKEILTENVSNMF